MNPASRNLPDPDGNDILAWVAYCGGDVVAFQREFGGQNVYIPLSVTREHRIARAIGFQAATRLCQELARDTFAVPNGNSEQRRMLVLILSLAKLTVGQIASAAEITVRAVARIRRQLRDEGFLPRSARADDIYNDERY